MLTPLAILRHVLIALATVACIAPAHAVLLTVVGSGDGRGFVISSPPGISCASPSTCSAQFGNGALITLFAAASAGSTFSGWSGGGCSGTATSCDVPMSSAQTVTATFALIPTLQSALDNPALSWTTSGNAPWAPQTQVFVQGGSAARSGAIAPDQASRLSTTVTGPATLSFSWKVSSEVEYDDLRSFVNGVWTGRVISGEVDWTSEVINLPAGAHTIEWVYRKDFLINRGQDAAWLDNVVLSFPLTVSKSGAGSGIVTSSPAGIDCGVTCSTTLRNGTQVTLTAAASAGSFFTGWSGDVGSCGTSPICTVSMTAARTVTAVYNLQPSFPLTVTRAGTGSGLVTSSPAGIDCGVTCRATFSQGTQVTLTAGASPGSIFTGWSGDVSCGTLPTCTVSMAAARTVTAGFAPSLGTALDNTALSWTSSGNALWSGQSQDSFTGGSAARSGPIGPDGVSRLSTTVTGPGILGFWWKVSSEPGNDLLTFFINGVAQPGPISGEVDWTYRVFNLPPGVHDLEWRYSTNPTISSGQNAAWLDAVTFTRNPRDFSADGRSDLLWQNTSTGDRFVWFMNGAAYSGAASLGVVSTDWQMAGSADFNGDGQADILWQNTVTGDRFIWFMNGAAYSGGVSLGAVPPVWSIAGTGDFNGDGKPDILWQNTVTGDRLVWFMNGATYTGAASLGTVPTDWSIAGTGDYNTDGRPDILWQNTATGERVLWFMNGTTYLGAASLGVVPTEWSIVGTGDFNADARPDIVWQNNANGARFVWFMDGSAFTGAAFLGSVPPVWSLVP